jgi:Cu(I)/Ag(I) efflux system membrane protein CusA/SilA
VDLREFFQVRPLNLSVAVWVGFLALFGIATDDGVLMATYLKQTFERVQPADRHSVIEAVVEAGKRRIRPCLMTTATTTLALLPVLTSTGRGADVMVPMAIPSIGGMTVALITIFVVPCLYAFVEERKLGRAS